MKKELLKLIDLSDASYYHWKNKIKKNLINLFLKYFSENDIKEFNQKSKISKFEYLYSTSMISTFTFYIAFKKEIDNEILLNSLIRFFLKYKKSSDWNDIGGTILIDIDFNYEDIKTIYNQFIASMVHYQKDNNLHINSTEFILRIRSISIHEFLFIHYNILNNFRFIIEILESDTFRLHKEYNQIENTLYHFLIVYYSMLYNIDINDFKGKSNKTKFNKMKKYIDNSFNSDDIFDIIDTATKLKSNL